MPLLNGLQPMHLLLILVIILVVFGPSKLPELGSSLGKGIREFKRANDDFQEAKDSVTAAVSLEPTARPVVSAAAVTPLPTQPEPRHEGAITLRREEIE